MALLLFLSLNTWLIIPRSEPNSIENQVQRFEFVHPSIVQKTDPFILNAPNQWLYNLSNIDKENHKDSKTICTANNLMLNISYLATPWFGGVEYVRYRTCILEERGLLKANSNSQLIRGGVGKYGNLEVDTTFQFDFNKSVCGHSFEDAPKVIYLTRSQWYPMRQAIRHTYGMSNKDHKVVLFVSEAKSRVPEEDLVTIKYSPDEKNYPEDVYRALAMISWVYKYCSHVRFVALMEETTFVNIKQVDKLACQEINAANRYGVSHKILRYYFL